MKKVFLLLIAGTLAVSVLFGCNNPAAMKEVPQSTPAETVKPVEAPETLQEKPEENNEQGSAGNMEMTGSFNRHPLYLASDRLKQAFYMLGFQFADNGEGMEIEMADVTFATWEEPAEAYGWHRNPAYMQNGEALLRTRILPANLHKLKVSPPIRLLTFGFVYNKNDVEYPRRSQIEGFVVEEEMTYGHWLDFWNHYAITLFGLGSSATLESVGEGSYKITILDYVDGKEYTLGYTGPASAEALKAAGIKGEDYSSWVFVIDVDQFAVQYLSLESRAQLYDNDIALLSRFKSDNASGGYSIGYRAADVLRKMGYLEICGDALYPDGIYKKMNMIQEAWDANNVGYPLVEHIGEFTATRTVLTPALEKVLALNYERVATDVRVFEVGNIYLPIKEQLLPKEHFALSIGAYGPDVTLEVFTAEVAAVLDSLGVTTHVFVPTDMAIAYKTDECLVILDGNGTYLDGNFGRISEIACENFGIGMPAYMAQLELTTIERTGKTQRGEISN